MILLLLALTACSSDATRAGGESDGGNGSNGSNGSNGNNGNNGETWDGGELFVELTAISIEPASVTLLSADGARPEQSFMVIGTFPDGHKETLTRATFSLTEQILGSIESGTGQFVASGVAGGTGLVHAEVKAAGKVLSADAELTVRIERFVEGENMPPDADESFMAPALTDPARAAELVYPLEGALMPQNVFAADLQWLSGAAGDLFEITMSKPNVTVRARIAHTGGDFGNHYLVDTAGWRALAQTDPEAPVTVVVRRYDSAKKELVEGVPLQFSFARAALTGSIYYWDIQAGRIVRIDDGTNVGVQFMPNPAQGCVGCHSVSPSGRYMSGRHGGGENWGGVYDLTTDLTASPPPSLFTTGSTYWWFSTWSPDEKRMVVSQQEAGARSLAMIDPFTGNPVSVTGTMPSGATHPAWSPDGTEIAYVANIDNWGGDNTTGDIAVLPVTGPDTVGAPKVLHEGKSLAAAMPAGVADSYPSWSPDSASIAFSHGTGSRSENRSSALYLMGRDGGGVRRLDKACGGPATDDNFQPRFSPFSSSEYYWVSFLSRRDYGNAEAGTRGKDFQQIWVAAIKKQTAPNEDPSAVGYWLPGQSTNSRNISAYWAPRPCRKDGDSCSVGSECCGGDCRPNEQGELVCSPPPPESCRQLGQTCGSSADCCGGALCEGNVCTIPIQ